MRLTRVEIHGFKSFSDRTQMEFPPGLTAIVGPNGCGKSNIVDAIKWALGEQRPGALRGDEMLDVIFKGNGARPARNFAEVSLVFDNVEGVLPVEYSEVVITRRLFRSGESEYLINRQGVRLKDIRNLFMDTGLGFGAYSIMEQGRIDAVLSANPLDRRRIFEEAAGISRYRARRRESESKLDRTQQNLLRLGDVVEELEKQQRSLKYQAGRARSFETTRDRLRELKSLDYANRWLDLTRQLAEFEQELKTLGESESAARDQLAAARQELTALQAGLESSRGDFDVASEAFRTATAAVDALAERQAATRERIEEFGVRRQQLEDRVRGLGVASLERQTEREAVVARLSETREAVTRVEQTVAEHEAALASVKAEMDSWQAASDAHRRSALERLARLTECRNERAEADSNRAALSASHERVSERVQQLKGELEIHNRAQGQLFAGVRDLEVSLGQARERVAGRQATASQARDTLSTREAHLADSRTALAGLKSRHQALEELVARRDGVAQGARLLLEAGMDGIEGLVADRLRVPRELAEAVEAALGASAQALLVDTRVTADKARALLHREAGSRVLLIPRDELRPRGQAAGGERLVDRIEVTGDTQVFETLLGHVRLVDDLEGCHPDGVTVFVTSQGDLLDEWGVLHAGRGGDESGLITRASERDALATELVRAADRVVQLEADRQAAEQELAQAAGHVAIAEKAARHVETERERTRERELHAAERQAVLDRDLKVLESDRGRLETELAEVQLTCEARTTAEQELQAAVSEDRESEEERDQERELLGERITTARSDLASAQSERSTLAERREALESERRHVERALAERAEELQRTQAEQAELEVRVRDLAAELARAEVRGGELAEERDAAAGALDKARSSSDGLSGRLKAAQEQVETREVTAQQATEGLSAARMKSQEVAIHRQGLRDKVVEELEIDFDTQPPDATPPEGGDWKSIAAEIEDLRGRLARMGNVNLAAIDELTEVDERVGFLTTQRDDLVDARKLLQDTISRVNKESRERFVKTFEDIREHFRVIFRKLFQGGRADILLEEGVDVLDAGIDIVAAPPGKDQRSITLLSGGERTLTAVGLLFALFRTRPSPVCLLDEVDAALDETNIDRFCSVLEDFLGNSQFLVVTHARRTMSYADTIYGVTMQEHGVSKVLSLSLAEYEESKNGGKSTSSNGDTGRGDATEGDAGPEVTERSRLPDTAPDRRVESVQESDLSAS